MKQVLFLYNFKKDEAPWEFGQESSVHKHEIAALEDALRSTDLETLKFIFELRKEYPTEKWRPAPCLEFMLSDCARVGHVDTVSYLLSQGADARGYPEMHAPYISNSPIKGACSSGGGNMATIELLIKHGADPNVTIAAAASRGRTALVRQLLDCGMTPVTALSPAAEGPFLEIVRMLLEAGVDANESTGADSPLVSAISKEHTVLFNLLIERGADIKSPGTAEECVKYANKDGLESMLQLLEQHGVDINMPESDDK
jgi:ankyrin repeat protein